LNLTLCFGFGARREILAETFTVETGVELENDIPGGIRTPVPCGTPDFESKAGILIIKRLQTVEMLSVGR
jgi:hypothetical protein